MKQIIIESFTSRYLAEDFANDKSKQGYQMVNVAVDFSRVGATYYIVCMELNRLGGSDV